MTASNWSFFKSYAPGRDQSPVLKGLLNFYLQNMATPGFCGKPFFPGADLNLTRLAENMKVQFEEQPGEIHDLNLLGNFVDNHDMQRIAFYCNGTMSRIKNAIAWTMLIQGIPIIYYGTEHFFKETHPPMWNAGYSTTTPGYTFIRSLNIIRKTLKLHRAMVKVEAANTQHLIFSRPTPDHKKVFVFLNNLHFEHGPVEYEVQGILPKARRGFLWADVLHGYLVPQISEGKLLTNSSEPMVLIEVKQISLLQLQSQIQMERL